MRMETLSVIQKTWAAPAQNTSRTEITIRGILCVRQRLMPLTSNYGRFRWDTNCLQILSVDWESAMRTLPYIAGTLFYGPSLRSVLIRRWHSSKKAEPRRVHSLDKG